MASPILFETFLRCSSHSTPRIISQTSRVTASAVRQPEEDNLTVVFSLGRAREPEGDGVHIYAGNRQMSNAVDPHPLGVFLRGRHMNSQILTNSLLVVVALLLLVQIAIASAVNTSVTAWDVMSPQRKAALTPEQEASVRRRLATVPVRVENEVQCLIVN